MYIYQTLLSKATYSAFRLFIFLSVHVFSGNRTHNLCTANAMLYHWATGTQYISYSSLILIKITFLRTSHVSNTWFVKHFSLLQSLRSLLVFDSSINLWIIILMIIVFLIDTIKISIRIFVFNNLLKLNDLGSHYISNSMLFFLKWV